MFNPTSNKQQRRNLRFYCAAFVVSWVDDDKQKKQKQKNTGSNAALCPQESWWWFQFFLTWLHLYASCFSFSFLFKAGLASSGQVMQYMPSLPHIKRPQAYKRIFYLTPCEAIPQISLCNLKCQKSRPEVSWLPRFSSGTMPSSSECFFVVFFQGRSALLWPGWVNLTLGRSEEAEAN